MFLYTDIEDQIINRLKLFVPEGYTVIPMPEKEKDFKKGTSKVAIIVFFSDSNFDLSNSMSIVRQEETVNLVCIIQSPKLRGTYSIQEALHFLKLLLIGFKPDNLSKLNAQKIELTTREVDDNYFEYHFTLTGKKLHVETQPDEILPLLKKITLYSAQADFADGDFANNEFIETDILLEVTKDNFSLPVN